MNNQVAINNPTPTAPKATQRLYAFALGLVCGGLVLPPVVNTINTIRKSFDGPAVSDIPTLLAESSAFGRVIQLDSVKLTRSPLDARRQLTDGGYATAPRNEIAQYTIYDGAANKISVYELHPLSQTNWTSIDAERVQKRGTAVIAITNDAAGNFQLLSFQVKP